MEEEVPVQTFLKTQYFNDMKILINIAVSAWIIKLGSGDEQPSNHQQEQVRLDLQ